MENKNVFEETVKTLIEDAKKLQAKLSKCQENNNFTEALSCMRLLKDTLALIKEYDWELKYSEYTTDGHKRVSVWEQNHCGEIRNVKKYNVGATYPAVYIDTSTVGNECIIYINGKRMIFKATQGATKSFPLYDYLKYINESGYEIYIDNRGRGKLVSDLLDNLNIKYKTLALR